MHISYNRSEDLFNKAEQERNGNKLNDSLPFLMVKGHTEERKREGFRPNDQSDVRKRRVKPRRSCI